MSTSSAVAWIRSSQRACCAVLVLTLSVACFLLAVVSMTSTSGMAGMAGMPGMAEEGDSLVEAPAAAIPVVVAQTAWVTSPTMASMCDSGCVGDVREVCTVVAGMIVFTVMGLLLATRRDTFVGVLARSRPASPPRWRLRQAPWPAPSPISLCVLRV